MLAAILLSLVCTTAPAADPIPLTRDGRLKFTPVFVNEREVVYVELATPQIYRLTRLNVETGHSKPLHPKGTTSEFEPAFSADRKVYAYLKTVGVLKINLEIGEFGGAALGEVPAGAGFAGLRSPAVSPDRKHVVYSYGEGGRQHLFQVAADGSGRKAITDSRGINNWPSYSPDGRELVFASSREGDFEIYRMPAEGGDATRLTESPGQDIRPRYSPDGKRIAFTSHRDGNAEVYVMAADGTNVRRLTSSPDRDDYPDWSLDGKRLVFISDRGGKHDVYVMDVD